MTIGTLTLEWWLPLSTVGESVAVPIFVSRALRGLGRLTLMSSSMRWASTGAGAMAGVATTLAAVHARSWWLLPAVAVWAVALTSAAVCDALTQRIPTAVVRQGGFGTAVLLVIEAVGARDYRGLLVAGIASVSIGAVLILCWRFVSLGFGDVRLGVLGGLGLGHTTHYGIAIAVATFTVVTLTQACVVLAGGGSRDSKLPYGPALTMGFLLAAAW